MTRIKHIIMFLIAAVIVLTGVCFSACGNQSMGMGNYSFKHIHLFDGQESYCAEVKKWYQGEIGIEVNTEEFGSIWCAEGTYMLFGEKEKCPFCK